MSFLGFVRYAVTVLVELTAFKEPVFTGTVQLLLELLSHDFPKVTAPLPKLRVPSC